MVWFFWSSSDGPPKQNANASLIKANNIGDGPLKVNALLDTRFKKPNFLMGWWRF